MTNHSQTREVIADCWYTTEHIEDLGRLWEQADAGRRLFVSCGEIINKTGLSAQDVANLSQFPYSILLPLNCNGNHWTSIIVDLSKTKSSKITAKIVYLDSMNDAKEIKLLPASVIQEMTRIKILLGDKLGNKSTVVRKIYKHAWQQSDGSSCGPYSMKNVERYQAGKTDDVNPGCIVVRREQLDLMTAVSGIKACSTNKALDAILAHWIIMCMSKRQRFVVPSDAMAEEIAKFYAEYAGMNLADVRKQFIDEYGVADGKDEKGVDGKFLRHIPLNIRMEELKKLHPAIRQLVSELHHEQVLIRLRREGIMKNIECIRAAFVNNIKDNEYLILGLVVGQLSQGNAHAARDLIAAYVINRNDRELCLSQATEIACFEGILNDYQPKLTRLAKAYMDIHKSAIIIKTMAIPAQAKQNILHAQVTLLQSAVARNDASLLGVIVYFLQDFCAAVLEFITCGRWEPDFRKIEVIKKKLNNNVAAVTREDYNKELDSLECLVQANEVIGMGGVACCLAPAVKVGM